MAAAPIDIQLADQTPGAQDRDDVMVCLHFSSAPIEGGLRDVRVALPPLAGNRTMEVWRHPGPHRARMDGDIRIIENHDYALFALDVNEQTALRETTRDAYLDLLGSIREHRHRHVIKAWNIIPEINQGEGDHERYRQFCLGRSEAFDRFGIDEVAIPAGTAVGSRQGQPLQILILTSQEAPRPIENPRQVSAYRYPREYGPRSPTFARAAVVNGAAQQLFLSGTAAIVGHRSQAEGDAVRQAGTTLDNIRTLLRQAHPEAMPPFRGAVRAYVRQPGDGPIALDAARQLVGDPDAVIALEADICRRELLLEIDGLAYL